MTQKQKSITVLLKILYWKFLLILAHCLIPFMIISEQFGLMQYNWHQYRLRKVKKWVANQLVKKGIKITGEWSYYVSAEPTSEQEADFREVYSMALRRFSDIAPAEICAWAKPLGALDKKWATSVGIDEYSAPQLTAPCFGCGKQDTPKFVWGNDERHKELYIEDYRVVLKPEYRDKITRGYICKNCWSKYCDK